MRNFTIIIAALVLLTGTAYAQNSKSKLLAKKWEIVSQKSKIEFQATQEKSPILGSFEGFVGKINFDPNQLGSSRIVIEIDTTSVKTSFANAVETLKTAAWLASTQFPKATFSAEKFTKLDAKKFRAEGVLSLKGKAVPLGFDFTLEEYSSKTSRASGSFVIKRSDFGVGDSDPKKANGVKEEVAIKFVVVAEVK